jgi:hypothetical protein
MQKELAVENDRGTETLELTKEAAIEMANPMEFFGNIILKANELGLEGKQVTHFNHSMNPKNGSQIFDLKWKKKSTLEAFAKTLKV